MPVYEIKHPSPPPEDPKPKKRIVDQVDEIDRVAKIISFKREWKRQRWKFDRQVDKGPVTKEERSLRAMVDAFNHDLSQHGIKIHLSMIREKENYLVEIFDCSDSDSCQVITDIEVPFDDVFRLIRNLHDEVGMLVDTDI